MIVGKNNLVDIVNNLNFSKLKRRYYVLWPLYPLPDGKCKNRFLKT